MQRKHAHADVRARTAPDEGENPNPILPKVMFETCPVHASMGVLGRRWAFLVLRDVIFFGPVRYSTMLHHNPGLTPRVLSMRLRELRAAGLIARREAADENLVTYELTDQGRDIIPVVTALIQYGMTHHADVVFHDGRPRKLEDVFPETRDYLLGALKSYATVPPASSPPDDPHARPAPTRTPARPPRDARATSR